MVRDLSAGLTYRDYVALPDDGRRCELHDGEMFVTPAPSYDHQRVIGEVFLVLRHQAEERGQGRVVVAPVDVILSETTVVQPDLVYLANRWPGRITGRGVEGPPTLVVEVLSPSTMRLDRGPKRDLYARHGVPYYWIVDPEARAVEAYALGPEGYTLTLRAAGAEPVSPPPFEGLALVADALWP